MSAETDAPERPPEGKVWVPESTRHRQIYHTRRCPAAKDYRTNMVVADKEELDGWRECKECAGESAVSNPKRECPLCGEYRVLGNHLPECAGGGK